MRYADKRGLLAGAAMLLAGAAVGPAWAQQSGASPQSQAGAGTSTLGELIVTAERREQRIQDVPATIAAINTVQLQREDIKQLSDYLTTVPGVDYGFGQGPTGARGRQTVGIRGVERTGGLEVTSIGYYIDETSIDIANPRIFDLNRIEVLSGPQGTLYGASSMGGTIKLITNQPDLGQLSFETDERAFDTDHGGFGDAVNQMANLPIVQGKVALRVDGSVETDPGYIDNYGRTGQRLSSGINGEGSQEYRAALLIQPNDNLQITPSVYYHWLNEAQEPDQVGGTSLPRYAEQIFHNTQSAETFTLTGLNIKYNFGFMNFVSQTSYYDFSAESNEDLTLSFASLTGYYPVGDHNNTFERKFSEEDRLVSDLKGPFQFVVGVYYDNTARPFTSDSFTPGLKSVLAAHGVNLPLPTNPTLGDNYYNVISTDNQSQVAGYGEGTLTVLRDVDLNVGLRVFRFDSSNANIFNGYLFQNLPPIVPGHASESGVDPKFNLTWRATHDFLVYATVDRGFRPGNANIPLPSSCDASLNASGVTPPGPDSFQSDSLWNYEAGLKTSWFDNRLTANVSLFRMNWNNIQVVVPLPSCKISGYIVNGGNAISEGVEYQLAAQPMEGLTLSYEGAYNDAYLTQPSKELAAPIGARLLDTPLWSMSFAGDYGFPLGDVRGYAHADIRYRAKTELFYSGIDPSDSLLQTNLRVGVLGHSGAAKWDAAIYVDNLMNTDPVLSYTARAALGGFEYESVTPRTIGLNLTLNY